jgi:RNA ligase
MDLGTLTTVQNMDELSDLVARNPDRNWGEYGMVNVKRSQDRSLILFDYAHACQVKRPHEWNWFERVSRGLILNTRGEVVARPFAKFWNYGEIQPEGRLLEATEKMDGSLGIMYWQYEKGYRIATRGSFNSDQALWATGYLQTRWPDAQFPLELTLLFEIIYPENRIVIDYEGRRDLVLIGAINRFTGNDLFASEVALIAAKYGFSMPRYYGDGGGEPEYFLNKAAQMSSNEEGFVLRYSDGTRVKVKGQEYVSLHRWIWRYSFKNVLEAVAAGRKSELLETCPAQMRDRLLADLGNILGKTVLITAEVEQAHEICWMAACNQGTSPTSTDDEGVRAYHKAYAEVVMREYPHYQKYLFARRNGKDYEYLIYKHAFEKELASEKSLPD